MAGARFWSVHVNGTSTNAVRQQHGELAILSREPHPVMHVKPRMRRQERMPCAVPPTGRDWSTRGFTAARVLKPCLGAGA